MSVKKGRNREEIARGCCLSIALHPVQCLTPEGASIMDDSGQALDLPPNRRGFSYRCDFGGQQLLAFDLLGRKERPFRTGVRSESELLA
jgi:hypothetical protein